jgi:hydroxypyruvate isomerase
VYFFLCAIQGSFYTSFSLFLWYKNSRALHSGKWHEGECGLAALPGREREFRDSMLLAFEYAQVLECQNIHVLAGVPAANANREQARSIYASNLAWAAEQARLFGVEILIEPIARRSIIGYFLNRQEEAHAIVEQVAAPNLKVIMDLYHCQLEEGDLAAKIRKYLADPKQSRIGHFQIGGVPDHHEPDTGEVNYNYLFKLIDELGYEGWVGCEYRPAAGTAEGLGWLKKWKAAAL